MGMIAPRERLTPKLVLGADNSGLQCSVDIALETRSRAQQKLHRAIEKFYFYATGDNTTAFPSTPVISRNPFTTADHRSVADVLFLFLVFLNI